MATANKDTYAIDNINGAEVRRLVKEGDAIPQSWTVAPEDVEDEETPVAKSSKKKRDDV